MIPLLAASLPPSLAEIATLVLAGTLIAYISFRLGLVPIVGFLIAGVAIGPNALGLVKNQALIDATAEIGVMLLLFTIGIEFSLEKLARIKRLIFLGGGLQVLLATAATAGLVAALGADWRTGVFTGFLVSLSSTAIVMKLLADRGETNSLHGQMTLGLLIFQDLAVIVMVLLMPALAATGNTQASGGAMQMGMGIGLALLKAGALIAVVLVFARRLMPPLLDRVARTCSPELFLLTVIAICLGTAYATALAGVSVSLGAFLAGLLVSESRFSHHALGEIMPLQILFSATFFVSVGMLLDVRFLVQHLPLVLAGVAAVLAVKVVTTAGSALALGYRLPVASFGALLLAQIGEFSFVLERAGRESGLSPAGLGAAGSQAMIAGTVLLMVGTPLLARLGDALARKLERRETLRPQDDSAAETAPAPEIAADNHVILAGYGDAARWLTRALSGSPIPVVVTTLNPDGANEAEARGFAVLRGDSARRATLELAGVRRAKVLVVADSEPEEAQRVIAVARSLNPTLRIVTRTRWDGHAPALLETGADRVVTEERESVVETFAEVLRNYQVQPDSVAEYAHKLRLLERAADNSQTAPLITCDLCRADLEARSVLVRPGAAAAGRPLSELNLPRDVAVRELLRNDQAVELDPAVIIQPADRLILAAPSEALAAVAEWFQAPPAAPAAQEGRDSSSMPQGKRITLKPRPGSACGHTALIRPVEPSAQGCEDCLKTGDRWVHLRICMVCGHVGCCDSSKNRHARRHWENSGHPVIRSMEPGEDWGWCFDDQTML